MYTQKELPGFKLSPAALWPSVNFDDGSFKRDAVLDGYMGGALGPEYDEELSSLFTKDELYRLFRFYHKPHFSFTESRIGLYPRNAYDANLLEYMRTFIVPQYGKQPIGKSVNIYQSPWDIPDDSVVMNGAYNGVPHPGWIEALAIVKKQFPDKTIAVGIGSNFEIENVKIQYPEGNTKWRASLLAHTGIFNGIFTIRDSIFNFDGAYRYPEDRDWSVRSLTKSGRHYYDWWSQVYGRSSSRFPFAVVVNGDEELMRKSAFINSQKTQIFDLRKQQRLFGDFHSSKVKLWSGYSADYVKRCWEKLREKLSSA